MQNKWLLYLALGFMLFGMIGWTRTAYYLWTNPDAYQERQTAPPEDQRGMSTSGVNPHESHLQERAAADVTHTESVVQKAVSQLAALTRLQPEAVEVLEVTKIIWPDASLGCPKPGMVYAQVQQEGLLIRLQAAGRIYSYHSGPDGKPFLCTP